MTANSKWFSKMAPEMSTDRAPNARRHGYDSSKVSRVVLDGKRHARHQQQQKLEDCELRGGQVAGGELDVRQGADIASCCFYCCRLCYPASECGATVGCQTERKVSCYPSSSSTKCKNEITNELARPSEVKKQARKCAIETVIYDKQDAIMQHQNKQQPKQTRCKTSSSTADCAKCQLVAHWTSAQARLAASSLEPKRGSASINKSPVRWANTGSSQEGNKDDSKQKINLDLALPDASNKSICKQEVTCDEQEYDDGEQDDATISSLTVSCNEEDKENNQQADCSDSWSLQSAGSLRQIHEPCSTKLSQIQVTDERITTSGLAKRRLASLRKQRLYRQLRAKSIAMGDQQVGHEVARGEQSSGWRLEADREMRGRRRPAPPPPPPPPPPVPLVMAKERVATMKRLEDTDCRQTSDSFNKSATSSRGSSLADGSPARYDRQEQQIVVEPPSQGNHSSMGGSLDDIGGRQCNNSESKRLDESEILSIEHCLRSHRSSIYVCGCMANLYLTSTELVDNGRISKPASSGRWQLNQTGVPVLTFDSGQVRNRDRRQLSISLAERGSGFVLWSDIIDHLSNYRAYEQQPGSTTCDTFHVMYLSSNHRLMVGLSFDDAYCARLFLSQVELVTSDPTNIALTGPKLAVTHRISRLGRLLGLPLGSCPKPSAGSKCSDKRRAKRATATRRPTDEHQTARPAIGGWSTLRRAIDRFGGRGGVATHNGMFAGQQGEDGEPEGHLLPRPLPALAMAGRIQQRAPRKCDISAPCLFQHVIRVDRRSLSALRSRILVLSPSTAIGGETGPGTCSERDEDRRESSTDEGVAACGEDSSSGAEYETQSGREVGSRKLSLISQDSKSQASSNVAPSTGKTGKPAAESICGAMSGRSNSTPSCYSSASHSPASSECGVPRAREAAMGVSGKRPGRLHLARPTPPKVPIRGATQLSITGRQFQVGSAHQGDNKIQAIIKELEAHTSAELVEAKRRLMADIADQVLARVRTVSHL